MITHSLRPGFRGVVTACAVALSAALVTGCGSDTKAATPQGWETLDAQGVAVDHPAGWKTVPAGQLAKTNEVAATLTRSGGIVAKIAVQKKFMQTSDVDMAAMGAKATYVLGGGTTDQKPVTVQGTDKAQRMDYAPQESNGQDQAPPSGTSVEATDVVALDGHGDPFLVRIIRTRDALPQSDLDKIVKSIRVTG
ncbi:hypothetical protein [Streptomyces sp. NPDC052811]|uniref:hypothetical protein n=1 Tax=Streptomyces sp. NPDC052811 TaxID=3155731 RepID=UPI0034201AB7